MRLLPTLGTLGLALSLTGCAQDGEPTTILGTKPDPSATSARLRRFDSCDALRTRVTEAWTETALSWRYGYGYAYPGDAEAGGDSSADGGASGGSSGPTDYSETNNQGAGVDEADIVKTDGNYLYVLQSYGSELSIVKSWPAAETALEGSLTLDGYAQSMFLEGDTLVVFSMVYDPYTSGTADTDWTYGYAQRISIIDVSDRSAPEIVREIDVEGYLGAARKIDGDVYAVVNGWVNTPEELWTVANDASLGLPEMDWSASEERQAEIRAEARALLTPAVQTLVDGLDVDSFLPRVWDHLPGEEVDAQPLLDCTDLYAPESLSQLGTLALLHLDADAAATSEVSATGIFSNGWTVYANADRLYVAQTSWSWWWGWGAMDTLQTHIHRFALDGADTIYEASGAVDGWLLNQFSMDEHEEHLRVATTDWNSWGWGMEGDVATSDGGTASTGDGSASGGSSSGSTGAEEPAPPPAEGDTAEAPAEPGNNVFVLELQDDTLVTVGEVRGLAPGEQIYAARFMGDTGYVVTFRQTDPLFVLDLSTPTAPEVVGELHVNGYSGYLHPVDGGYLLAVGMDGTADGTLTGFAVSLFDVRDPTNPTRLDQLTVTSDNWSWSESLWDHHAFTFHDGVLSVPIYTYDYDETTGAWDGFSGMLVAGVDTASGVTELGRVDHADMVADSACLWSEEDWGYDPCAESYWYANMRRSVVIEGNLYSISDYGVKVTEQADPNAEIARVLFRPL